MNHRKVEIFIIPIPRLSRLEWSRKSCDAAFYKNKKAIRVLVYKPHARTHYNYVIAVRIKKWLRLSSDSALGVSENTPTILIIYISIVGRKQGT